MKTKDKITNLFEYQKFERNPHLDEVINSALNDEVVELSDEVLFAAAGGKASALHKEGEVVLVMSGEYANETGKIIGISNGYYKLEIKHSKDGETILVEVPFSDVDN